MSTLKMAKGSAAPQRSRDDGRVLYDEDFFGWTQDQADLLRSGRLDELDIANLLDEVESLGRSVKRKIESRFTVLLVHLLKWRFQPGRRSRSWKLTIMDQRRQIGRELDDSPSLRTYPAMFLAEEYDLIRQKASVETDLPEDNFPAECPFHIDDILDPDFYPDGE